MKITASCARNVRRGAQCQPIICNGLRRSSIQIVMIFGVSFHKESGNKAMQSSSDENAGRYYLRSGNFYIAYSAGDRYLPDSVTPQLVFHLPLTPKRELSDDA